MVSRKPFTNPSQGLITLHGGGSARDAAGLFGGRGCEGGGYRRRNRGLAGWGFASFRKDAIIRTVQLKKQRDAAMVSENGKIDPGSLDRQESDRGHKPSLKAGGQLGDFKVVQALGRGGMGCGGRCLQMRAGYLLFPASRL